jgi:DNA-binding response OmpR family regulator
MFLMEPRVENELSIVIVEEPCLSRNVLVKALGAWGYSCEITEDEDTAVEVALAASAPVLILADWHADFMGCDEFFWRVRSTQGLQGVYLLSAVPRGAVGAIRQCISSGADDYVYRPYDLDEVRVRLHLASKVMGLTSEGSVFPD